VLVNSTLLGALLFGLHKNALFGHPERLGAGSAQSAHLFLAVNRPTVGATACGQEAAKISIFTQNMDG